MQLSYKKRVAYFGLTLVGRVLVSAGNALVCLQVLGALFG